VGGCVWVGVCVSGCVGVWVSACVCKIRSRYAIFDA
jgi:hypothetical protein